MPDVTILALDPSNLPAGGETLIYNATTKKWEPGPMSGGGGSAPDATTSVKGIVQLAGDLAGTAAAPTVVAASATVAGKVELATTAEATTGTDTVRAVTPAGLKTVADTKAAVSHTHAAADIASGTVAYARLPVGTTASTVAAGDDARIGKIGGTVAVSGTPTAGQVPVASSGTAAAWGTPAGGSDPWTYVVATADTANATTTATNATGLSIPALANGLYEFEVLAICTSTVTTTGAQVGLTIAGATGATVTAFNIVSNGATGALFHYPGSAQLPLGGAALNAPTTGSQYVGARMEGTIRAASMTGTIDVTIASENTSSVSIKADSFIRYRKIAN